jgi:hypothetical protein
MSFLGFGGPKKTAKELARENKREIRKGKRELEREKRHLERGKRYCRESQSLFNSPIQ